MGVIGLMNTLKLEGAKYNVHTNSIAPTATTRMTEHLFPAEFGEKLDPKYIISLTESKQFCFYKEVVFRLPNVTHPRSMTS